MLSRVAIEAARELTSRMEPPEGLEAGGAEEAAVAENRMGK